MKSRKIHTIVGTENGASASTGFLTFCMARFSERRSIYIIRKLTELTLVSKITFSVVFTFI